MTRAKSIHLTFCLLAFGVLPDITFAGLIAEWKFDEGTANTEASGYLSILDTSGNNLHGTPLNGPTYRAVPYGGLGLQFDGVDDRVTVSDDPLFRITKSLTIEASVRVDYLTGKNQTILERMDDRSGLDPYLLQVYKTGVAHFRINDGLGSFADLKSPDALPLGVFAHVAGTLDDGTGAMKLWVNGKIVAEMDTDVRPFAELDPTARPGVGIGSWSYESNNVFNGIIDNVRIYDEVIVVPEPSTIMMWSIVSLIGGLAFWQRRVGMA